MNLLYVEILEAKPNKMFTEAQRQSIRFLRYNRFIKCSECAKKRKVMWTMLCEFKANNMGSLVLEKTDKVHLPLTPVCQDHLLSPNFEKAKAKQ